MDPYKAPLEGRRNLLRLDFNENTIGPSPKVLEALQNIPKTHISIYPEYAGLKEALIKNLKYKNASISLNIDQIGLFNGVDAAINAIFHSYGDKKDCLLTTQPTFGYYRPCADMQGMVTIAIPYEGENFDFPLESIKNILKEKTPRLLLICNPNNPTGTKVNAQTILELANKAPETLIVIDELYEAFNGDSVLPVIDFRETTNVVVLQSLSKTAGLAGLRIGFAFGNNHVINCISRVTGPYDINTFAVTAAKAALEDQKYIDSYVSEVFQARDWLKNQLNKKKIKYHLNAGNYLLIWPKLQPKKMEQYLRDEGILIRDMSSKPLIEGAFRVSIGSKNQMLKFWNAFVKYELI